VDVEGQRRSLLSEVPCPSVLGLNKGEQVQPGEADSIAAVLDRIVEMAGVSARFCLHLAAQRARYALAALGPTPPSSSVMVNEGPGRGVELRDSSPAAASLAVSQSPLPSRTRRGRQPPEREVEAGERLRADVAEREALAEKAAAVGRSTPRLTWSCGVRSRRRWSAAALAASTSAKIWARSRG
jgi:hypothetical protein